MITLREYAKQPDFALWSEAKQYLDFYMLLSKTRDSVLLDTCNFEQALEALGGESEDCVILRFWHWGCGRIEYIAVSEALKAKAEAIESALADYPVLNDEAYSAALWDAATKYWEDTLSLREKVEYCKEGHVSILQARKSFGDLDSAVADRISDICEQ